ncbi:coproporphyrinogen III oxidase, aerobic [Halobacteriovorax marinus SJ]|uniref:coproporphyrinogen oxidase n=1 Tax=Halobacteriovorax marinus (strain ATCC BAA-682 / DSM 15412 / SJ) TaxID=862908 RepID=E1WZ11_HALMS|nr:oxygen-dependent coproporphyrinogen oxidase [Halobacteriovorax marinus]CBW26108.1 coproporphyrinogen III oxidase, aerobic [Halobacteriovorax marinus SJ]
MLENLKQNFVDHVRHLQNLITEEIKKIDPSIEIIEDNWKRKDFNDNDGGGGITRAFQGEVIENAGVNTSVVYGAIAPDFAKKIGSTNETMWATGISLIIHPRNPKVPTTHANFRMIQAGDKFWFGGGADLTPYYPHTEDFKYFHQVWADACKPYGNYEEFKVKCDNYFVNKHRENEMRGVGGIFFDHFNTGDTESDLAMVKDLSNYFIKSFFPIVEKRVNEDFTAEDEDFQLHRRGRYVEFNLLHDRGTMFGLQSNGRTDSILISLPGRVKYSYKYAPKDGSPHAEMMKYYYPMNWV